MDVETRWEKLEDICYEFHCAIENLSAIYAAMQYAPFAKEEFLDALHFVYCALYDKQEELQNLLEKE